jgi:hypothetical protein
MARGHESAGKTVIVTLLRNLTALTWVSISKCNNRYGENLSFLSWRSTWLAGKIDLKSQRPSRLTVFEVSVINSMISGVRNRIKPVFKLSVPHIKSYRKWKLASHHRNPSVNSFLNVISFLLPTNLSMRSSRLRIL